MGDETMKEVDLGDTPNKEQPSTSTAEEGEAKSTDEGGDSMGNKIAEIQAQVTKMSLDQVETAKKVWNEKAQPALDEYTKAAQEKLEAAKKTASEHLEAYQPQIDKAKEKLKEAQEQAGKGLALTKEKAAELQKTALENYGWLAEQVKTKGPTFFLAKSDDATKKPFAEALKQGCEAMEIDARADLTQTWHVKVGDTIEWKFAVEDKDIEFHVAMRKMSEGGSTEEIVVDPIKVSDDSWAEGTWSMEESGTVVIVWDNKYSWLTAKRVAYSAKVIKAGESPMKSKEPLIPFQAADPVVPPEEEAAAAAAVSVTAPEPAGAEVAPAAEEEKAVVEQALAEAAPAEAAPAIETAPATEAATSE